MQRKPAWVYVVAVMAGLAVLAVAEYLQYRAKIAAYMGAETAMKGDGAAMIRMTDGIVGSIATGLVLSTLVCVTVFVVTYVTRSVISGACVFVLSVIPAGIFGSLLASYLVAHEVARNSLPSSASHAAQWKMAFGQMWVPGMVGLALGWFAIRRIAEQHERDLATVAPPTRAQIEARNAELAERERAARENRKRVVLESVAAEQSAQAPPATTTFASEAVAPAPPVHEPPPRAERVAIACPKCGASNAPVHDRCLVCHAHLVPAGAN